MEICGYVNKNYCHGSWYLLTSEPVGMIVPGYRFLMKILKQKYSEI